MILVIVVLAVTYVEFHLRRGLDGKVRGTDGTPAVNQHVLWQALPFVGGCVGRKPHRVLRPWDHTCCEDHG